MPAPVMPPAPGVLAEDDSEPGGLQVTVTDESAWQDLGIAIPAFATNANVATAANTEGTARWGAILPA